MANEDAKSHRSAGTSSNDCTPQAFHWQTRRCLFASEQLLARLASAKKAEYQARQVCEPLALQVCDPFDAGELTTKARMANEDAKSHRSVYDSSNNCTLQASNA